MSGRAQSVHHSAPVTDLVQHRQYCEYGSRLSATAETAELCLSKQFSVNAKATDTPHIYPFNHISKSKIVITSDCQVI